MDAFGTADVRRIGKLPLDKKWPAGMAIKVNLEKYLKIAGRWQFVPAPRVNGMPEQRSR